MEHQGRLSSDRLIYDTVFYIILGFCVIIIVHCQQIVPLGQGEGCVDNSGTARGHLDQWSNGQCSRIICFHGKEKNFTINYNCRRISPDEKPDPANCYTQSNESATFPECCPVVKCNSRGYTNWTDTTDPPCFDESNFFSCTIWSSRDGCNESSNFYNYTVNYCRLTCGQVFMKRVV